MVSKTSAGRGKDRIKGNLTLNVNKVDLDVLKRHRVDVGVICRVALSQIASRISKMEDDEESAEMAWEEIYGGMKELDLEEALILGFDMLRDMYEVNPKVDESALKTRKWYEDLAKRKERINRGVKNGNKGKSE